MIAPDLEPKTTNEDRLATSVFFGVAINIVALPLFFVASAILSDLLILLYPIFVVFTFVMFWRKTPQIDAWMERKS